MKRSVKPLIFSIFITFIVIAQSGRISNGDLWVDYANAGYMKELAFSFILENDIDQFDYIKIGLPFPLHAQLTPAVPATEGLSSPSFLVTTYQTMNEFTALTGSAKYCQVLTETIDSSNYYVRFYDTDRKTIVPISKNQWYYIKFKLQSDEALQYQKSNSILQIQMSTVSSVFANAIVYDDNLAFNYFQLGSTPPSTISLIATPHTFGSNGGYLLTQASYHMYLDVTMNIESSHYTSNLVLKFLIKEDDSFKFTSGACSSIAKTNAPTIPLLTSSLYTCTVDTVNNIMQVKLTPTAMTTQSSYRFTVGITNPAIVKKNVNIEVRAVKETSKVIIASGSAVSALNTNQIYVTYQEIFVGWGLRPDALLPFDARLFRGNSATPSYLPYNSLSTKFSISRTTSSAVQLKIVIDIPSQANAFVLQNGFTHNLPAFPNKVVKCTTENADSTTSRQIGCTGVGALTAATVYEIGWKMFFPYDNYQSSLNCTLFGTMTVYTVQKITSKDVSFILGRSNEFLSYLKSSAQYQVIGRNASYISYMKTFLNLNLVVLSNDFQEFLKMPQSIYLTNRPKDYTDKTFNDVYVINQNLAFLTYISLFDDIYVASRLTSDSDISKGLDAQPLIAKTTPKNTLTIPTANSKDWTNFNPAVVPLVSSVTGSSSTPGTGLSSSAIQQSIVFNLKGLYADVTTFSNLPATSITDKWGMQIMMNNKISKGTSTVALRQASASGLTIDITTQSASSAYNKYTLITIKGLVSDAVQSIFPISAAPISFGVFPLLLDTFSSIYSNDQNMDIMIATLDGIDGPNNKISYNGFFLINGFTMVDTPIGTLNMGFVNYQSSTALTGETVPTFLRVKGSIAGSNIDSLSIFFDALTPFYANYYSGDVYCYSSDGAKFCSYHSGAGSQISKYNYQSMARIQVALTTPNSAFDILIPVTHANAQTVTNFYLGYQTLIAGKKKIAYIEAARAISVTATATATGSFGPTVSGTTVGATVANLGLSATGTATTGTLTQNSGNNIGSAFSYFSQHDYFGTQAVSGWSQGPCRLINYVYYYTNYEAYLSGSVFTFSYKKMTGIVCLADTSTVDSVGKTLTIASSSLPSKWGKTIPGYGAYSNHEGKLKQIKTNYQQIGAAPVATLVTPPIVGASITKTIGKWILNLGIPLNGDCKIVIVGDGANIPFTSSGTCAVYIGGKKSKVGCIFDSITTQLDYTLTINEENLLPKDTDITILHYGMTNSAATQANVNVNITCYSLVGNSLLTSPFVIWEKKPVQIVWQPSPDYLGASNLQLNTFSKINYNKQAVSDFKFNFVLVSKGLYVTNRIRIDLGQLAIDNTNSLFSPKCVVLQYSLTGLQEYSHDWAAVDSTQGFNNLQLWPEKDIYGNNLAYTVKCYNFKTTSSPDPTNMTAKVVNTSSDLTGDGVTFTNPIKPMQLLYNNNKSSQVSVSKKFSIPSSLLQLNFTVLSPGITVDSVIYIGFPSYYANGLGPDIKCYTSKQIFCEVDEGRELTVKYLGTYAEGTSFMLQVVGITQPINYNSGNFYYLIDNDDNPSQVLSAGDFIDPVVSSVLAIQNFPTFPIYYMQQSSSFLREDAVSVVMDFFLSTSIPSISVGQSLYMIFPPIYADVLRFMPLTCTLNIKGNTLKNYINSCSANGLRVKMPFLDDIVLGSTYTLTVSGIVNPTNPSANVYKYSLEISDSTDSSTIAKSYSPQGNFVMPVFITNPDRLPLNYYTVANGLVRSITTMTNIQSEQIFISPTSTISTSFYQRNVYLSVQDTLYSVPSKIDLLSGSNPSAIRMSSLTSGVNYVYFTKTGDGNFYSSLPPLTLITNKNYFVPLSFMETTFSLPIGSVGSNYSIVVNLPQNLYPMSQVSMTVTINSAIGISLKKNPTVITFYPQKTSATIDFQINDATLWVASSTVTMTITPNNTNTYSGAATVTLNAVARSDSTPTVTMASLTPGKKDYIFNVKCSEFGKFVYHVSRVFSYNTTACSLSSAQISYWLQQSTIDGLRVTQTFYSCEDILGTQNIVAPGVNQQLTISNLQASTTYALSGYCQTQHGLASNLTIMNFNTQSNNGVVNKVDFYFESPLTTSQKIKLVCALALFFKVDYFKVSTWDGYYCSQLLSRLLQTQQDALKTNLLSQDQEHQQQVKSRLLTSGSYRTDVYFGINNGLNTDNTRTTILTESMTTNIKTQLNTNVVGLPVLLSYNANAITYVGASSITNTPFVFAGPTYCFIKGIQMTNNGLIYAIVGDQTWTREPLISQIKQGSGPNGLPPLFFRVLNYRTSDTNTGNMAWTDMPQGKLKLYLLPSDDNPFDNANFGSLVSFNISREVASFEFTFTVSFLLILLAFTAII